MNNTTSLNDTFILETFLWVIPTAFLIVLCSLKYNRLHDRVELK